MCLRAREERLSCAGNTSFSGSQKTADIVNYTLKQRATQKKEQSFKHKRMRDPPLVSGCWAANWKSGISDPWNGLINAYLRKVNIKPDRTFVLFLATKKKQKQNKVKCKGWIITSSCSCKICTILIWKGSELTDASNAVGLVQKHICFCLVTVQFFLLQK